LGQLALVHAALTLIPPVGAIALGDGELGLRLAVTSDQLVVPDGGAVLREGDEVVLINHRDNLDKLNAKLRRSE
jgi:Trk K+ transport system NAD-binding subunit